MIRACAIILFVTGFTINYLINRRRFNRTMVTGMQSFRSYERAVFITLVEKLGKLIAILLMVGGVVFFVGYYLDRQTTKQHSEQARLEQNG